MNFLRRINQGLLKVEHWMINVAALVILIMMVATTYDIITRSLGHPVEGVYEGVEVLIVIAVYLGLAYVQYSGKNVRMEILITRLSGKTRLSVEILNLVLPMIVFAITIWMTGTRAWQSILMREVTFKPAEHPIWVGRSVLTVGLFFLWLRIVIQVGQKFYALLRRTENSEKIETNLETVP